MPKLTKRFIDKLEPDPAGKDKFVWDAGDGAIKGFGIRMKPSGIASYLVQYRNKEGRTRRLVIGKLNILTPEEARKKAAEKLKEASDGGDPSADRHALRGDTTVTELCDLYLKDAKLRIKPSTLSEDRIRIECHVKPLLGRRKVRGITRADVEKFQTDIATGKTAKPKKKKGDGKGRQAKGGRGVAARTLGMLITIMEFAKNRQLISENVARGVRKFEDSKKRVSLSVEQIRALGKAIRESETENPTGIAAIRALLLTGCRKNEILSLPRDLLDEKARCLHFGDTKSGPQTRPIGVAAVNHLVIQPVKRNDDGEEVPWIFPADRGEGHFVGLPKVLERLCKKAELKNVTLHTLRHTFASIAAELGFSELTIAAMLGHSVPGVTARYTHLPDRAVLIAADVVSEHIAFALAGKLQDVTVITLRSAKP